MTLFLHLQSYKNKKQAKNDIVRKTHHKGLSTYKAQQKNKYKNKFLLKKAIEKLYQNHIKT